MLNIQYIKIPFVSAFSIDDYAEALTLGISISGDYIEAGYAVDSFTGYLTGFNRFFSGSGYWLASGSSLELSKYLLDTFSGYSIGSYQESSLNKSQLFDGFDNQFGLFTGNIYNMPTYLLDSYSGYAAGSYINSSLNQTFFFQGYDIGSGLFTGNLYQFDNYLNDNFFNYQTGTYNTLTGNVFYNTYNTNTGIFTGNLYTRYISWPNSGYYAENWTIVDSPTINDDGPFVGTNSFLLSGNYFAGFRNLLSTGALIAPNNEVLTNYTLEYWVKMFDGESWVNGGTFGNTFYPTILHQRGYITGTSVGRDLSLNGFIIYSGLPLNQWIHMAATFTGLPNDVYISGTNIYNAFINYSGQNTQTGGFFRNASSHAVLYGALDVSPVNHRFAELRLWNYTRSQSEILSSMNTKINPASQTGLLLYLSL